MKEERKNLLASNLASCIGEAIRMQYLVHAPFQPAIFALPNNRFVSARTGGSR